MDLSQRAAESARHLSRSGYQTDFSTAPYSLQLTQAVGSDGGRPRQLRSEPRVAATMSTRWNVQDNLCSSAWSITLDAGVIARAFPFPPGGFERQFPVQRASTPEVQRMLRSPAPPLRPRMIQSMREHQERGYNARTDGCKTAVHTATPLKREATDNREPFVRGGPGLETVPRFS